MRLKPLLTAILAAAAPHAGAIEFMTTNELVVAQDDQIVNEQWILAGTAQLDGTYEDDLQIATADSCALGGLFRGNVAGAGAETILTGRVGRNLRLLAPMIRIEGRVDGNVLAAGRTIVLGTNSVVMGDAVLLADRVVLEGAIRGDARITATTLATFAGKVEGDADTTAGEILFTRGARVAGDFHYQSPKEFYPAAEAIGGELRRTPLPAPPSPFSAQRLWALAGACFAALLVSGPFISLFPITSAMGAQLIRRAPIKCLAVGLLASLVLPVLALMAIVSEVGLPLGALLLAAWGAMLYLGQITVALVVGSLLLRSFGSSIRHVLLSTALGLALIYATQIPSGLLSATILLLVLWFGMGSLILALIEKRRLILQVPASLEKLGTRRREKHNPEE